MKKLTTAIASTYIKKKAEGMKEENPEEILSRNKRNFSIDHMNIDEICLKRISVKIILNQKQKIVGKKQIFYFSKKQRDAIESTLMKTLPNKTVMKSKKKLT